MSSPPCVYRPRDGNPQCGSARKQDEARPPVSGEGPGASRPQVPSPVRSWRPWRTGRRFLARCSPTSCQHDQPRATRPSHRSSLRQLRAARSDLPGRTPVVLFATVAKPTDDRVQSRASHPRLHSETNASRPRRVVVPRSRHVAKLGQRPAKHYLMRSLGISLASVSAIDR